jgi:hypothetical protein
MPYQRMWGSNHPGYLIVLIDQSNSMGRRFHGTKFGAGKYTKKSEAVAAVLNSILNQIVLASIDGADVKSRADITVLGYEGEGATGVRSALGAGLAGKEIVTPAELNDNPLRIETATMKMTDENGGLVEYVVQTPFWVEAVAGGSTPMCAALQRASDLAERWVRAHPDSFPPVVMNITDGGATDGRNRDILAAPDAIHRVATTDGNALLFTSHITEADLPEVTWPADEADVPNNRPARMMFRSSSVIPGEMKAEFSAMTGTTLRAGTRGYIFNGDATSVRAMLKFGSSRATQPTSAMDPSM